MPEDARLEGKMEIKKQDKRVRYTKLFLKEALITLMQDKPVSQIKVTEICQAAEINRATFYSYYTDPMDLLATVEQEVIDNINMYLQSFDYQENPSDMLVMLTKILEYIEQNEKLCLILLGGNGNPDFQRRITMIIREGFVKDYQTKKAMDPSVAEYVYTYIASGSFSLILKWLEEERRIPLPQMAEMVVRLSNGAGL